MDTGIRDGKSFTVVPASRGAAYEGLRSLWVDIFYDIPPYVDAFFENFGDDIAGYAVSDENGEICAALTCYRCGEYMGRPVYVSYAICTREDMRGHGLASMLTAFARDLVTERGGISIVAPAEQSLIRFYRELGYEPHFFVAEKTVEAYDPCDAEPEDFCDPDGCGYVIEGGDPSPCRVDPDLEMISPDEYGRLREAYLAGRPHIKPTDAMLRQMQADCMNGCGMYRVNKGDAICVAAYPDSKDLFIDELIVNPALLELSADADEEIAAMIAGYFGAGKAVFIAPGEGLCQGMACGLPAKAPGPAEEPYYGFPIK